MVDQVAAAAPANLSLMPAISDSCSMVAVFGQYLTWPGAILQALCHLLPNIKGVVTLGLQVCSRRAPLQLTV